MLHLELSASEYYKDSGQWKRVVKPSVAEQICSGKPRGPAFDLVAVCKVHSSLQKVCEQMSTP